MEHFAVDDLVISLMARRKECMHALYTVCAGKIDTFMETQPSLSECTLFEYLNGIEKENTKLKETAKKHKELEEKRKETNRKRQISREKIRNSKRRKSMIVTIDDVSFSFGKDELEQITSQEKQVDPEVKDILLKMNDLFKQLGKKS